MIRNRMISLIFIGLLIMFWMVSTGFADELQQEVVITIFPCTDAVSSFNKFNPLITYLNKFTRLNARLEFFRDFDSFERAVTNGALDFVLQEPHIYLQYVDNYNPDSLLRTLTWEGKRFQAGVVIARRDSNVRNILDLKGKSVMFGPRVSSSKWAAAKLLFKESGIDIDVDLKEYSNGGCCEDIAFNVYLKAVDAGVICDHFLSEHSNKQRELGFDAKQLAVIGTTGPVPTKVFTATRKVAPDIVNRVNQALLSLDIKNKAHQDILNAAELGGFLKTNAQDFGDMKTLLDSIAAE